MEYIPRSHIKIYIIGKIHIDKSLDKVIRVLDHEKERGAKGHAYNSVEITN